MAATLTWTFDGSGFQLADSSAGDSPASGGELAFFTGPGLLVDLGANLGVEAGGSAVSCPADAPCPLIPAAEDWQWSGSGWTPVQNVQASAAAPYFEGAPVTDTGAGEVVGLDASGVLWASTTPSAAWVKAPSSGAPPARTEPALAYDGSTRQVVLFGGELLGSTSTTGEVVGDTWTWDGTGWTQQGGGAPTPSASATPVPTGPALPSQPALPSASAVTSPSLTPQASGSASAMATATATATASATASGALPAIAPITG
jgi:hypothetical protein